MGSETPATYSGNAFQRSSNYDETSMQHTLQFSDTLMDLKNLRKQLYSAAEYFESSYDKDEHKQLVVESSKDYVSKAVVSTVDHLGSVADKLGKFLDEKANEFSETNIKFSCIEQRLKSYNGFIDLRGGRSQESQMIDAPKHNKRYIYPAEDTFLPLEKVSWRKCTSFSKNDTYKASQGDSISIAFRPAMLKPQPPLLRKGHSMAPSNESSPKPLRFPFSRVISNKEAGKRSDSPFRFPLIRSGSVTNRSVSPIRLNSQQRWPSEPRRATVAGTKPDTTNNRVIESYNKKSKHLFKALLSVHRSRKDSNHR